MYPKGAFLFGPVSQNWSVFSRVCVCVFECDSDDDEMI